MQLAFRLYHIFPRYLIDSTIFGKKVIEHKMYVVILSTYVED